MLQGAIAFSRRAIERQGLKGLVHQWFFHAMAQQFHYKKNASSVISQDFPVTRFESSTSCSWKRCPCNFPYVVAQATWPAKAWFCSVLLIWKSVGIQSWIRARGDFVTLMPINISACPSTYAKPEVPLHACKASAVLLQLSSCCLCLWEMHNGIPSLMLMLRQRRSWQVLCPGW